jgi:hypothetical protein
MTDLDDRLQRLEGAMPSQPPASAFVPVSRWSQLALTLLVVALGIFVGGALYGVFAFRPAVGSNPGTHIIPSGTNASLAPGEPCYVRPDLPQDLKPFVACVFIENQSTTRMALITAGTGRLGHGIQRISACSRSGGSEDLAAPWTMEVGPASDVQYESDRVGYSFVGEPAARLTSGDVGGDGIVFLQIAVSASGDVTIQQLHEQPSDFVGTMC